MIRTLTNTALIHHMNEVLGPLYHCMTAHNVDSANLIISFALKMASGGKIRQSYECLPLLSLFLCVKNDSSKDRFL